MNSNIDRMKELMEINPSGGYDYLITYSFHNNPNLTAGFHAYLTDELQGWNCDQSTFAIRTDMPCTSLISEIKVKLKVLSAGNTFHKDDFVTLFCTADKLGRTPSSKIQVKKIDLNE